MKRYIAILLIAIMTIGCDAIGGPDINVQRLGHAMWEITRNDIHRINEIFTYVMHYDHLQTIEDEADRDSYIQLHFRDAEIVVEGDVHTLTYNTAHGTSYSVTFEFLEDGYHVTRTGGMSYDLTLTLGDNDAMEAHFANIRNIESVGHADLVGTISLIDNKLDISYIGDIVMVDHSRDYEKPLTMTTEITKSLKYNNIKGIVGGKMTIIAHDELYDSTDVAYITILEYHRTVIIKCYDTELGYSYNSNI